MMNITILCVGKIKEKFFTDAVKEYEKRISRFAKLSIVEIPDEKNSDITAQQEAAKIKEGAAILSKIPPRSFVTAMCIEGTPVSSEELAKKLDAISLTHSHATFIIGGSLGLSDEVKSRADARISFGKITLPHQLMRVVLTEQLYRAFKINNNESYHK